MEKITLKRSMSVKQSHALQAGRLQQATIALDEMSKARPFHPRLKANVVTQLSRQLTIYLHAASLPRRKTDGAAVRVRTDREPAM